MDMYSFKFYKEIYFIRENIRWINDFWEYYTLFITLICLEVLLKVHINNPYERRDVLKLANIFKLD